MSVLEPPPSPRLEVGSAGSVAAHDLPLLLAAFHDAATKLQVTHEALRAEVARLEAELREAHDQLKRARQLAALGEMAAGIAHEVRNPLGSIRLYAGVLTQDLADRPAERAVASKIADAVCRLDAVVGDVLAFSRDIRLRVESVDAHRLLADAVEACTDLWSREGIRVMPAVPRTPLVVACDPPLMHQALVNVLRNAAEAMRESPRECPRRVWLSAGERRVAGAEGRREPMRVLSIRDSGPGVPPDALHRLFNPFFTTRHAGTGLGLAIVHRIMDAHGGRVVIENNTSSGPRGAPACGATVEFFLPVAAAANADQLEAA
jgi:signal transduction histidine kinase